ncbi:hypothetical protein EIP86_001631 [Pleurotus ostreatoroseus]|nr:hypothetical protein EIP86_001631 [Pleurotus ostreatoroseus]
MAKDDSARTVTQVDVPRARTRADLVKRKPNSSELEEYVATLHGYVVKTMLPPITTSNQLPKNPRHTSQSIILGGLGASEFEESVQGVLEVYNQFRRSFSHGVLQDWEPRTVDGHLSLMFSNRFYSSSDEARGLKTENIDQLVDPFGILAEAVPDGIHTIDNQVLYYERYRTAKGKLAYRAINPAGVKQGYLVEVQASFCAVPVARNQTRTRPASSKPKLQAPVRGTRLKEGLDIIREKSLQKEATNELKSPRT